MSEGFITEDQLLSSTEELKRNLIAFIILMVGLLVGVILIFIMIVLRAKEQSPISQSDFTTGIVIGVIVIIVSVVVPVFIMVYTSISQKLLMEAYKNQQVSRDTFESPIYTERGRFVYQIQTPSSKARLAPTISLLENVIMNIDFSTKDAKVTQDFKNDIIELLNLPEQEDMEIDVQVQETKSQPTNVEEVPEDVKSEQLNQQPIPIPNQDKQIVKDLQKSSILETLRQIRTKFDQLKSSEDTQEQYEDLKIRLANKNNKSTIYFDAEPLRKLKLITNTNMCNFQIGYRNVLSIKCLDDPEYSDYDYEYYVDEFGRKVVRKVYKDRLMNISGFCYIINGSEGDVFDFQEALSNDSMPVKVRKTTNKFSIVGWLVKDQIPLLYCLDLDNYDRINSLILGFEPLKDSTIHALIELYAKESKVNDLLRNENIFIKRNNLDLKEHIDKGVNDKFEEFLEETDVPKYLREKVEFQKANITTLVVSILTGLFGLILGILIG